jgi:hypothetical protein
MVELINDSKTEIEQNENKTGTETEQNGNKLEPIILPRAHNVTEIKLRFDNFEKAILKQYYNDYEFFLAFISEYNGKSIKDYSKLKKSKKDNEFYYTARFPARAKIEMFEKLETFLDFSTQKISTKETRYKIYSINQEVFEKEKEMQSA